MVLKRTSSGSYRNISCDVVESVAIWTHISAVMATLSHNQGLRSSVLLHLGLILQDGEFLL